MRTREFERATLLIGLIAAAALAVVSVYIGALAPLAILAVGAVVVAFLWPIAGLCLYAVMLPLVGGIERGLLLPLFRPHEALHFALLGAIGTRAFFDSAPHALPPLPRGAPARAVLILAFFASIPPLLWFALRHGSIPLDEALTVVPLWRYTLLFLMVRLAVRTPRDGAAVLASIMTGGTILTIIVIGQGLGVPIVHDLLELYWIPPEGSLTEGRGTATLTEAIATGSHLAVCASVAVAWLTVGQGHKRLLAFAAATLILGTVAVNEFSAVIALGLMLAFGAVFMGQARRALLFGVPAAFLASIAAWPIVSIRLAEFEEGGLPGSWLVRWDNLHTYYIPQLLDLGFILGVRPQTGIAAPEQWRNMIWLESGYLWLLWVGGIPLFAAFVYFSRTLLHTAVPIARARTDSIGVAAMALISWFFALLVLMILDPHLTTRGAGDLLFILFALATSNIREVASDTTLPESEPAAGDMLAAEGLWAGGGGRLPRPIP